MKEITIRELRNNGSEVVERVLAGEYLLVTRNGHPVAELSPVRKGPLDAAALLERWRTLPKLDGDTFRSDIDNLLDTSL